MLQELLNDIRNNNEPPPYLSAKLAILCYALQEAKHPKWMQVSNEFRTKNLPVEDKKKSILKLLEDEILDQ